MFVFFLCKQKAAYELRISDGSSDVCSSDLRAREALVDRGAVVAVEAGLAVQEIARVLAATRAVALRHGALADPRARDAGRQLVRPASAAGVAGVLRRDRKGVVQGKSVSVRVDLGGRRSTKKQNEHTS